MPSASRKSSREPVAPRKVSDWNATLLLGICLAAITFVLFWPVRQHDFINYDDPDYVTANAMVQAGITAEGIKWAFTSIHAYNWHPVTWMSHMTDVQFFGMNPGAHHLVSVGFHIANVLLLLLLFRRVAPAMWPAAIVAAIFAWHPLHVESVSWACERKDVLSTFFWLLATHSYALYVEKSKVSPGSARGHYLLSLSFFGLGLMSKPMLVTLPFTLLLLDIWPLNRFAFGAGIHNAGWRSNAGRRLLQLSLEKAPFFALSMASSVITFFVQTREGAVVALEHLPVESRLANAVVSYVRYLGKTFWPMDLTIYYPPSSWAGWQVGLSLLLILCVSVAALLAVRKQPPFFVGWFWFLGTLVPAIGIVQVGAQAIADRYMYVPMIGLSIAVIWPLKQYIERVARVRWAFVSILTLALGCLLWQSSRQVRIWRNNETVFKHAISIDGRNLVAGVMLANSYLQDGKFGEAEKEFKRVLAINPDFPELYFNLGNLYVQQQRTSDAITQYEAAITKHPNYAEAHANLGVALGMQNRFEEAIAHYDQSLTLQPNQPDLLRNIALDLMSLRRFEDASLRLQRALELDPSDAMSLFLLGNAHLALGKTSEAAAFYTRALQVKPDFAEAEERLASLPSTR